MGAPSHPCAQIEFIYVEDLDRKTTFVLSVAPSHTIFDVKAQIKEGVTGIETCRQRLFLQGREHDELEDGCRLEDCNFPSRRWVLLYLLTVPPVSAGGSGTTPQVCLRPHEQHTTWSAHSLSAHPDGSTLTPLHRLCRFTWRIKSHT